MRQALAAGWVAFVYLVLGVSPAHFWLDAGEIAAAGAELGIMHPPGGAVLVPLLRLATLIPLGSLGFRMAVLSAVVSAAAVGLAVAMLERRRAHPLVLWGTVCWILAGLTFVRHGRVVEVYGVVACMLMFVLWCLDPATPSSRRGSRRLLATFVAAMGSWLSGELRLVLAPLLLLVWFVDLRRARAWVRWAPLFAMAGTAVVLGLPVASARDPMTDWGNPESMSALIDHLGAVSIRAAFADQILPASAAAWWSNTKAAVAALAVDLGPVGPVAALSSLLVLCVRHERGLGAALAYLSLAELFYAVGINPMGIEALQTGLNLALLSVLSVGLGLHHFARRFVRLRWVALPLGWTLLILPAALKSVEDIRVTRSWGPHAWTRGVLRQLPPRSLLLTQSDDLAAGMLAAQVIEGARPDVASIPAQHLYRPVPDHIGRGEPGFSAWAAAAKQGTERRRTLAAIEAHPAAVAVEHPAAGIFQTVPWWSEHGRLPLGLSGPGVSRSATGSSFARQVDHWLPRLPSHLDRKRLAIALANAARALVRVHGAAALPTAEAALKLSLRRVFPGHAAALVALGALADRRGDTATAIALTRAALELEPERPVALGNLARYLARTPAGLPEAVRIMERAVRLHPHRRDLQRTLAMLRRKAAADAGSARERGAR